MASTLFSNGTVVQPTWLNEVDTDAHATLAVAGTNTITATGPVSMTAYAVGQRFFFMPAANNTGAVTININGLGPKAITKLGAISLITQDLLVGTMAEIVYDGTNFQLLDPQTVNLTQIIPVTNGGTGATTAGAARTNLGAGATGDALFTSATAAAARTTLGVKVAGNYASYQAVGGTTTLTVADVGKIFEASVVAPTVNLPVGSTCALGDAFHFANSVVLTRQSSDQIVGLTGVLVNSFTTGNYPITVTWRGSGVWSISAGAVRALNTNPGYMNLPGGVLCQFGSSVVTTNAGGQQAINFGTPFTGSPYTVIPVLGDGTGTGTVLYHIQGGLTASSFTIELRNSMTGAVAAGVAIRVNWVAFGTT